MRRFIFRLQSILNLKEKKLEDERLKLAGFLSLLEEQKNILEHMLNKKKNMECELETSFKNGLDVQMTSFYRGYIDRITNDIRVQNDIIKRTETDLARAQNDVNNAYKEVKIYEKLKEKQKEEYIKEAIKQEIKETDDITNSRRAGAI